MKNFISYFTSILVVVFIVSCKNNSTIMTMTTHKLDSVEIGLSASSGSAIINWGDGTQTKARRLWSMPTYFSHSYSDTTLHTITITPSIFACITSLNCAKNQLTSLNVSKNTRLKILECLDNNLTKLDVSKNLELSNLSCSYNQLTNLDLKNNIDLEGLVCDNNLLTALDMSKNRKLMFLLLRNNNLSVAALNTLFETLHNNHIWNFHTIYVGGNQGVNNCKQNIAMEKGWNVDTKEISENL